jgi:hypothetical protein
MKRGYNWQEIRKTMEKLIGRQVLSFTTLKRIRVRRAPK